MVSLVSVVVVVVVVVYLVTVCLHCAAWSEVMGIGGSGADSIVAFALIP